MTRPVRALAAGLCAALLGAVGASAAFAQAAQVTTEPGPHYVGEPVSIRITAVGFEEDPPPVAAAPAPADGELELVGMSPSVSQSITIVNGHMSRTREVTHVFQFRFVGDHPGTAKLGPFKVTQGKLEATVPAVNVPLQAVPSNEDVAVDLHIGQTAGDPLFVGERVPVSISFTLERSLQQNVLDYTLRVPFFDDQQRFRFLDDGHQAGDTDVVIETAQGRIQLRGLSREHVEKGKHYTTVEVTRTLVPLVAGRFRVPPASFSVEEGTRFRRDFFGGRRATEVRRWRAETPDRFVEVAAVPGREKPPSFGGAIGRGFTLDVAADRTVLQVGDPITLTFEVRGDGLETASLPPLDAKGLLPGDRFRVPDGPYPGEVVGDAKRFTVLVRVLDAGVSEIPGLAYSWFDPDTRQYETTHSRPIALSVHPAEVIGAGDVEVAKRTAPSAPGAEPQPESPDAATEAARARSFALTGADLAVEPDPARVLGRIGPLGGAWLPRALYAGSLVLVALAVVDRRRRDVDPEETRRARVVSEQRTRLREARRRAPGAAVAEAAQALRRLLREAPGASDPTLDALLGECDARSYAPPGREEPLPADFFERCNTQAERLARAIAEQRR